jgi:hypothetical protein
VPQPRLYTRSIVRKITSALKRSNGEVLFVSPYLTPSVADNVIRCVPSDRAKIVTTFSLQLFASGASSIKTFDKLIEDGYSVFAVPMLHAKMVVTEEWASIGSQNLTAGGTRNLEASYFVFDPKEIRSMQEAVANWIAEGSEVSHTYVEAMKEAIPEVRKQFLEFSKLCEIGEVNWQTVVARKEEEARRVELAKKVKKASKALKGAEKRSARIRQVVAEATPTKKVPLTLRRQEWKSQDYWGYESQGTYTTLKADTGYNILETINSNLPDGDRIRKRQRYLMVDIDTGRLCWPALNKTQITQLGDGLTLRSDLFWPNSLMDEYAAYASSFNFDRRAYVEINFIWDIERLNKHNVEFTIDYEAVGLRVSVDAYFNVLGLEIDKIDLQLEKPSVVRYDTLTARKILAAGQEMGPAFAAYTKTDHFRKMLTRMLVEPFQYTRNSTGHYPSTYFGDERPDGYLWLSSKTIETNSVLSFIVLSRHFDRV